MLAADKHEESKPLNGAWQSHSDRHLIHIWEIYKLRLKILSTRVTRELPVTSENPPGTQKIIVGTRDIDESRYGNFPTYKSGN